LEKLPGFIKKEQEKIAEIQKDLPVLQEVVNGTWSKETRLSELKTELAAVERKIQLSIEPVKQVEEPAEQTEKSSKLQRCQKALSELKVSICHEAYYERKRGSASPRSFFINF
jgi:small-conductance mechanosensitive channel